MADKEWRPSDWVEIKREICNSRQEPTYACADCDRGCTTRDSMLIEDTASSMFKALIKWLFELCKDHHHFISDEHGYEGEEVLRKDCPSCMRQLQESE